MLSEDTIRSEALRVCGAAAVMPVIVLEDAETAVPVTKALVAGGLKAIEITLRTAAAMDCIEAASTVEGAIVGAGTLLSSDHIKAAKIAGAEFGVTPGSTIDLLEGARKHGLPLVPGVATVSEAMAAMDAGYSVLKFFPAEANGGAKALKSIGGPLPQLSFCPTGGVTPQNAPDYLSLPNVVCVGGSWVVPKDAVEKRDWAAIEALARAAAALKSTG